MWGQGLLSVITKAFIHSFLEYLTYFEISNYIYVYQNGAWANKKRLRSTSLEYIYSLHTFFQLTMT